MTSTRIVSGVEDLFSNETSAVVGFEDCREAHPRFQFEEFAIPPWLTKYKVIHIIRGKDDPMMAYAVLKLYHVVLDNQLDQLQMACAIEVGETLAIVRPGAGIRDKASVAVAAITFSPIGQKLVVLYFGVDNNYRNSGFGTQLLMLMGLCVKHRCGSGTNQFGFSMFLYANQEQNPKAVVSRLHPLSLLKQSRKSLTIHNCKNLSAR